MVQFSQSSPIRLSSVNLMLRERPPIWQILLLALAVILAVAVLGFVVLQPDSIETAQAEPSPTAPWPTPRPTATPAATRTPTPTPRPTRTPTPTPTATPRVTLLSIQALGRLESANFIMETVIDLADEPDNQLLQQYGSDRILLIAHGEVIAGIDLKRIPEDGIIVDGDSVTLMLPPAEIFSSIVDNENTRVYERETNLLSRVLGPNPRLESEARRLAQVRLQEWALENGILQKASENATAFLRDLLIGLGFTEINISIQPPELEANP